MTKTQSNPLTIGVLGGMGPEATADLFSKIIAATPAEKDQHHLHVIIDSNPGVPDRTAAILGEGESPVPAMATGCTALSRAGADFIVIPCVSAHMFLDELQARSPLPVHSLFEAVTAEIAQAHPRARTAGLIATTGTVQGGRFQANLKAARIETIVPEDNVQKRVMDAIYDIKNTKTAASRNEIGQRLAAAAETLLPAAEIIVAGCTEVQLALTQGLLSVPFIDAVGCLARDAVHRAIHRAIRGATGDEE